MALKIKMEDRVSTYPGRVVLRPVSGEANTYDMERADMPITEGTKINKALFDSKADTVSGDVTVYVSSSGSDITGNGNADAPFKTIQVAIDAIPKDLGGHTVSLDITAGTYNEVITCEGFTGGKLVIGSATKNVIIRGLKISACTFVELNVRYINCTGTYGNALLEVANGSVVSVPGDLTLSCNSYSVIGLLASMGSVVYLAKYKTVNITASNSAAASATSGGKIVFPTVTGSDNMLGLVATMGGVVTYEKHTLASLLGDNAETGGSILTGGGTINLANASVE